MSALMLTAASCSSAPKGDGNDAEIEKAANAIEARAEAAVNQTVADIEAEAVQQAAQQAENAM